LGGLRFKASPGKKFERPPSQQISWAWWYMPVIPATQAAYIGGLQSRPTLAKTRDPIQKLTKAKRGGLASARFNLTIKNNNNKKTPFVINHQQ
jgi:hypothetical protein